MPEFIGQDIGSKYDWNLSTVPQTYLDGLPRPLPQGRVLGGGTILNGMLWNRGSIGDYGDWVQLGNPGWSWDDMLPYFKKVRGARSRRYMRLLTFQQQSETYTPVYNSEVASQFSIQEDLDVHGFSGPVNVSFSKYFYNSSVNLFDALSELGVPTAYDPNAGNNAGASFLPTDINPVNQSRCDARVAYYDPYVDRPNLWVMTGQTVTRLLFGGVAGNVNSTSPLLGDASVGQGNTSVITDAGGIFGNASSTNATTAATTRSLYQRSRNLLRHLSEKIAKRFRFWPRQIGDGMMTGAAPTSNLIFVGVEYAPDAQSARQNVSAAREVIVSAGAIHSPQLLMLSGIGPASALQALQIPVAVDIPGVGNNLQDHYLVGASYPYNNASYVSPNELYFNATYSEEAQAEYLANRTGPWTTGSPDGVAFPALSDVVNGSTAIVDAAMSQSIAQYLVPGLDPTVAAGFAAQLPLLIGALQDTQRAAYEILNNNAGELSVATMRPFSRGTITLNSSQPFVPPLIDPRYGSNPVDLQILLAALLFNRQLLATQAMQWLDPVQLLPSIEANESSIMAIISSGVRTEYHPSGTCAMMPLEIGGVVDSNLLVYGTQNLRVVDASIIPIIPASHLQAVIYGIAEKAADIIKAASGFSTASAINGTTSNPEISASNSALLSNSASAATSIATQSALGTPSLSAATESDPVSSSGALPEVISSTVLSVLAPTEVSTAATASNALEALTLSDLATAVSTTAISATSQSPAGAVTNALGALTIGDPSSETLSSTAPSEASLAASASGSVLNSIGSSQASSAGESSTMITTTSPPSSTSATKASTVSKSAAVSTATDANPTTSIETLAPTAVLSSVANTNLPGSTVFVTVVCTSYVYA